MKENIYWEIKKINKNKGKVYFIMLILFSMFSLFYQIKSDTLFSTTYYGENQYEEIFYGKWDEEKENLLQETKDQYVILSDSSLSALQKYQSGKISKEECLKELSDYRKTFEENRMLDALSLKIEYVKNDPEKHYFVNENGWNLLLKDGMDIFTFIYIIILVTLIFYNEKRWEMLPVIRSSETGFHQVIKSKIITFTILLIAFIFVNELLKFLIVSLTYSLKGFNFPVQSIQLFDNVYLNLSIIQYYLFMLIAKTAAYLLIGLMGACICRFFSQLLHSMAGILIVCLFPILILSDQRILGFIPYLGLLYPSRYISSDMIVNQLWEFTAYTNIELLFILFVTFIIVIIGLCYLCEIKLHFSKKYILIPFILLSGCHFESDNMPTSNFNLTEVSNFASTNDFFYIDHNGMFIIDKATNQSYDFNRWPLWFDSTQIRQFFVTNDECYFLVDEGLWNFIVYHYNDDTGQITPIYEEQGSIPEDSFILDEFMLPNITAIQANDILSFFIIDDHLYLYRSNNTLESIHLNNNKKEAIIDNIGLDVISFANGKLYYLSDINTLYSYDLTSNENELIINDIIYQFKVYEDSLYYLKYNEQDALYSYSLNNGREEKIIDGSIIAFSVNQNGIFYTLNNDHHTYFYSFKNKQSEILYDESYTPFTQDNQIYFLSSTNTNYLICKSDGKICKAYSY